MSLAQLYTDTNDDDDDNDTRHTKPNYMGSLVCRPTIWNTFAANLVHNNVHNKECMRNICKG